MLTETGKKEANEGRSGAEPPESARLAGEQARMEAEHDDQEEEARIRLRQFAVLTPSRLQ